jgi:hypothetical protein
MKFAMIRDLQTKVPEVVKSSRCEPVVIYGARDSKADLQKAY